MYFCLDFVGMKCKCSMCIEVELLTSSIFYLIMSKFRRTGVLVLAACGNTCDVDVVNQAPLSNPCVLVVFFVGSFGGSDLGHRSSSMEARRGERRTDRGRWPFLAIEVRN